MEKKSDKKGEPILNKERTNTANKKQRLSACTEAYKEHIMYTFTITVDGNASTLTVSASSGQWPA